MNVSRLLAQRNVLLRQARLANLAYAHQRLSEYGARIARASLHGEVTLQFADPSGENLWPTLTARECSQAVIDEHFLDEDIAELADILVFLCEDLTATDFTFRLEELEPSFVPALQAELEAAGVDLAGKPGPHETCKPGTRAEQDR
ncbi:hypothetical protein MASR2M8_21400 [Opitutaceae bacterium]